MKGMPMAVEHSYPSTCEIASGVRSLNCSGPETTPTSTPKALEEGILQHCSHRCRICPRSGPVGAPGGASRG
eukprot:4813942-Alexandrium_andersonii.AAC.1